MFRSAVLTVVFALAASTAYGQDNDLLRRIEREIQELPARTKAAQSKVEVGEDVVTITATDLDDAKDKIFESRIKYPGKQFKVIVAPPEEPKVSALLKGKEVPLSLGKSLARDYRDALDALAEQHSDLAKRMRENPTDVRGSLDLAELALGLDKLREGASLVERCYRVAWAEGLSRYGQGKDVSVTFLVRVRGRK